MLLWARLLRSGDSDAATALPALEESVQELSAVIDRLVEEAKARAPAKSAPSSRSGRSTDDVRRLLRAAVEAAARSSELPPFDLAETHTDSSERVPGRSKGGFRVAGDVAVVADLLDRFVRLGASAAPEGVTVVVRLERRAGMAHVEARPRAKDREGAVIASLALPLVRPERKSAPKAPRKARSA